MIGYRKKIVRQNISNSFPKYSLKRKKEIEKKFFKHLCDIIVESVKMFSITKKQISKRLICTNPELPNSYFEKGKNLIIVGGHYSNWEMYAVGIARYHKHLLIGIYTELANKFFDKKVNSSRSQFGLSMRSKKEYKNIFETQEEKPHAIIFAIDQAPREGTGVWTTFLNQETAIPFGAEKLASEKNYPVLFGALTRVKRGHFSVSYDLIEENPATLQYSELSVKATRMLEKQIIEQPNYWLWSHRRWKRKRSENDVLYS